MKTMERRLDILSGIAQAGGFTKLARTSRIDLTRAGVTRTYDLDKLKKEAKRLERYTNSPIGWTERKFNKLIKLADE